LTEPDLSSSDTHQAAAERHQIFEKIALERLRTGADTSKPVGFLPLPVRLTTISAASITGLGVLWACLAQVPVQVNGIASLAPQEQVSSAIAQVGGVVAYQVSGAGPDLLSSVQRKRNQALATYWGELREVELPSFTRLNDLALAAVAPMEGQRLYMPETMEGNEMIDNLRQSEAVYQKFRLRPDAIIARVENVAAMQELDAVRITTQPKLRIDQSNVNDRNQRASNFNRVGDLLSRQRSRQLKELDEREALFRRLQSLWSKGYVSTAQLLQEQAANNSLRNQVLQIDREKLNTESSRNDQLHQAEQTRLNSFEIRNQLQAALVAYMAKVYTFSPPTGMYVVSRAIRNGMEVKPGDELFTYSVARPTLPPWIPVFVDAATSQQLAEGMQVLVTPKGISRAQHGGIVGVVDGVGKQPLPPEGIAAFAGGRTLASSIQQSVGGAYLVSVKLEQAEPAYCQQMLSLRCYRWSTNRRPPFPVRLGTLADVLITVQYRRPIEFVMPALRQALGLVVENS
jgi:hypothetical protein